MNPRRFWLALLLTCPTPAALAQVSVSPVSLNPQVIALAAPVGSSKPAVGTTTLVATGAPASFTAVTSPTDWLSVSPASGTTPATLTISADVSKLGAGTYFGQVLVTAGSVGTYAQVILTVGSGAGGSLVANPTLLTFVGLGNEGMLGPQTLAVTTARGVSGPLAFTASANSSGNWLLISRLPTATPATLDISAIVAGLPAGEYTGAVTLTPAGGGKPTVVPVILAVTGTGAITPALTLSQSSLTITYQTGTATPPVQVVGLTTAGASASLYTAATTTSWLSLVSPFNPTPSSEVTDFLPGELSVVVNPAGLAPGTHIGTISIAAAGLPPQQLPVTLNITSTATLNVQPSSIVFDELSSPTTSVTVTSTGSANLSFTAASSATWLVVSPTTGSTATGSQALTIGVNPAGLAAGTYAGNVTLTVQGSGATVTVPVQLKVSASATPAELQTAVPSVELAGVAGFTNPSRAIPLETSIPGARQEFTAAASSAEGWLAVAPFTGTAPSSLNVEANPAAVAGPGTYDGSVVITSLATGAKLNIPVRFTLSQQAIAAEPTSLSFAQQQRDTVPPPKTIQVTANTASTFTASSASPWIRISPGSGNTPATLTISVNPAGLAPGTNSGSILISGPKNQLTIPVSLTVPEPPGPTVNPASLTFNYRLGSPAPAAQPVSIGSTGGELNFTAAAVTESGINWLTVRPASGVTGGTIAAAVDPALLVPGRHTGTITVASADRAIRRTVTVTVNVSAAPATLREVLHGATRAPTPLAPGTIVRITGTGLGPATPVNAQPTAAGAIETRLADTRVLFDSVPAPLLSVGGDQIVAIVPYALFGRLSAKIQLEGATGFSLPIEAKVVEAVPGIFTVGPAGRGQAAALNADFTPNSLANPIPRGGVIAIFGTGEGQSDPPGQDGRIVLTDLRRPRLPVTASLGNRPADVIYFGSAPMQVLGVFQANIRVPEDIEPGAVPVEIQVGGAPTQSGVTIAVR